MTTQKSLLYFLITHLISRETILQICVFFISCLVRNNITIWVFFASCLVRNNITICVFFASCLVKNNITIWVFRIMSREKQYNNMCVFHIMSREKQYNCRVREKKTWSDVWIILLVHKTTGYGTINNFFSFCDFLKIALFQWYDCGVSFTLCLSQQMMVHTSLTGTDGLLAPHSGDWKLQRLETSNVKHTVYNKNR